MKKLIASLALVAFLAAVSVGTVGCGDSKTTGKSTTIETKKTETGAPGDKKTP
jgi:hypothetical protein